MPSIVGWIRHSWNAFVNEEKQQAQTYSPRGMVSSFSPSRPRMHFSNERSIVSSIYTRLSIDVASIALRHVRLDENGRYLETIQSGLNNCLTLEANIDQSAQAFMQDVALTLFDKGVIAIVPVDTTLDPQVTGSFDITTMRVGEITQWYSDRVRVSVYNEALGRRQEVTLPKSVVAIVENPFYSVMNEPNSTLQRLIRKLGLLDSVDEAASSGKLDLIIQLPYVIKSEARRQQADQRRDEIEEQLRGSTYGIAYTDGTEKITQLNRPAENNMLAQIEYLTKLLYGQLGLTQSVFDGSADEATMLNYFSRTIEPVLEVIVENMKRKFLTKTARTQGQSIEFFRDPFKLVPVSNLAELADKFTRNEILSSNEFRSLIGYKPSKDPRAEQLVNKNLPEQTPPPSQAPVVPPRSIELKQIKP